VPCAGQEGRASTERVAAVGHSRRGGVERTGDRCVHLLSVAEGSRPCAL